MEITDFSSSGTLDIDGNIKELSTKEALKQSLKLFLTSTNYSLLYREGKGGFLYKYLMKPWRSVNVDRAMMSIRTGIANEFPDAVINYLSMSFSEEYRSWVITLEVYFTNVEEEISLTVGLGVE